MMDVLIWIRFVWRNRFCGPHLESMRRFGLLQKSAFATLCRLENCSFRPARAVVDSTDPWGTADAKSDIPSEYKRNFLLRNINFKIDSGEHWIILGRNGSGKSTLGKVLGNLIRPLQGTVYRNSQNASSNSIYLSFAHETAMMKKFIQEEEYSAFGGDICSTISTVSEFIGCPPDEEFVEYLNSVEAFTNSKLDKLSSGQLRITILMKTIFELSKFTAKETKPLIILDEPFDSLDTISHSEFIKIMDKFKERFSFILITHRLEEVLEFFTHIALMEKGKILIQGPRIDEEVSRVMEKFFHVKIQHSSKLNALSLFQRRIQDSNGIFNLDYPSIVDMQKVYVSFMGNNILQNFNWKIYQGQHWRIKGKNGSGKSTLLKCITGDMHFKGKVQLFDQIIGRGKGISIWNIKQNIGVVSSEIHFKFLNLSPPASVFEVIGSGFFDSFGLFRDLSSHQKLSIQEYVKLFFSTGDGDERMLIEKLLQRPFQNLSQGQQRLVLFCRALVKNPRLLILDEAFHGLDPINRNKVFQILDLYSEFSTILYVSHNQDLKEDQPAFITSTLNLSD